MPSKRKRKVEEYHVNLERWMISYADFLTLLFAVFVVLYAMSQVDMVKVKVIAESIQRAFGIIPNANIELLQNPQPGEQGDPQVIPPIIPPVEEVYEKRMEKVKEQIEKTLKEEKIEESVNIKQEPRGLVISLKDTRFFDTGSAELRPSIIPTLSKVILSLKGLKEDIRVEGHTDNVPINTIKYPSNWELSAARAMTVLRFIREKINFPPHKLSLAGYGEFRPIDTNSTEQGRARNRRVDIIILNPEYKKYEPKSLKEVKGGN